MIDMTTNKKDAESFITHVGVDSEKNCYNVYYADGSVKEEGYVNEHNDNFYLNKMEQQFVDYKDKYVTKIGMKCLRVYIERLTGIALATIGLLLDYNLDIHIAMKILIGIAIIGGGFVWDFMHKVLIIKYDKLLEHVEVMDYLHNNMDKYKNKMYDEKTGNVIETQIINFNNIEAFSSIEGMDSMYNLLKYSDEDDEFSLKKKKGIQ